MIGIFTNTYRQSVHKIEKIRGGFEVTNHNFLSPISVLTAPFYFDKSEEAYVKNTYRQDIQPT